MRKCSCEFQLHLVSQEDSSKPFLPQKSGLLGNKEGTQLIVEICASKERPRAEVVAQW